MLVEISDEEFKKLSAEEQRLTLYRGIARLNDSGCRWAKGRTRKMYAVAAASGIIGGFIAAVIRVFAK